MSPPPIIDDVDQAARKRRETERKQQEEEQRKADAAAAAGRKTPPPAPHPESSQPAAPPPPAKPFPPELRTLLQMDGVEFFDIGLLNSLSFTQLRSIVGRDEDFSRAVDARIDPVIGRVLRETSSLQAMTVFLTDCFIEWYTASASNPNWSTTKNRRWGGLFSDSTTLGGEKRPWIVDRLRELKEASHPTSRTGETLKRIMPGRSRGKEEERPFQQVIRGQVAQALLDDLAANPREPSRALPLRKLSDLALSAGVSEVSGVLADLFPSSARGTFIVLHPNRFPSCGIVSISSPEARSTGAALSFNLVAKDPALPGDAGGSGGGAPSSESREGTPWDPPGLSASDWKTRITQIANQLKRIETPPVSTYRQLSSYHALRTLLSEDREARLLFISVQWKGKPKGLGLLVTLWNEGKLVPETDSDSDYLESELNEALTGRPDRGPDNGVWEVLGWRIRRVTGEAPGLKYTTERSGEAVPAAPSPPPPAPSPLPEPSPPPESPAETHEPSSGPEPSDPTLPPRPPSASVFPEEPLCHLETPREEELWERVGSTGIPAGDVLGFTRRDPSELTSRYGLAGASLFRISTVEAEGALRPVELEKIASLIERHLATGSRKVVVIASVEHLVEATNVRNVRRLLDVSRDLAFPVHGTVLFSMDASSLPAEQSALLKRGSHLLP